MAEYVTNKHKVLDFVMYAILALFNNMNDK